MTTLAHDGKEPDRFKKSEVRFSGAWMPEETEGILKVRFWHSLTLAGVAGGIVKRGYRLENIREDGRTGVILEGVAKGKESVKKKKRKKARGSSLMVEGASQNARTAFAIGNQTCQQKEHSWGRGKSKRQRKRMRAGETPKGRRVGGGSSTDKRGV